MGEKSDTDEKIKINSLDKIVSQNDPQNDPLKKYEIKEKVGSGGTSKVYRAVNRHTGQQVAIKKIFLAKQDLKDLIKEIKGSHINFMFFKIFPKKK